MRYFNSAFFPRDPLVSLFGECYSACHSAGLEAKLTPHEQTD